MSGSRKPRPTPAPAPAPAPTPALTPAPAPAATATPAPAPTATATPATATATPTPAEPGPPAAAAGPSRGPDPAPKESRSEQRAAAVRAGLEPLGPGERPAALLVAIGVAGLLGLVNLVGYAAGLKIGAHRPGPGILSFSVVMGIGAWGMSRGRYWAVLGFQVFVALIVLYFCLLLILASNLEGLFLCLVVIGAGGWLFWKLVRVMARIQAPVAPSPD